MSDGLKINDTLDRLEVAMVGGPPLQSAVYNHFAEGLYIRECHFVAGTVGVTMVHRFRHPFIIERGEVEVFSETEGAVRYKGPCFGFTEPGTRRAIRAFDYTIWITTHPNPDNCRDVDEIVKRLTMPHETPGVPEDSRNMWRNNQHLLNQ